MEENKNMYCYKYPHPSVATDCVIFGFDGNDINVLLIERGIEPFKGLWAFPGGFMRIDESAEQCAARELAEETSLEVKYMEQLKAFSAVGRDPRERVVSIAFYALVRLKDVQGGDDAARAQWFPIHSVPGLAFDHDRILREATSRLREKLCFEPIGFDLLPEVFTMGQLQRLYEAILDVSFDRRNFAKKILKLDLLIEEGNRPDNAPTRIPRMYRFNKEKYDELKRKGIKLEF
ncbi:MAG: NUDIX hydrolase [Muribaculaceae bacterium]|nr:NUDIX hydrolase [Muribaculaceae bacterium]